MILLIRECSGFKYPWVLLSCYLKWKCPLIQKGNALLLKERMSSYSKRECSLTSRGNVLLLQMVWSLTPDSCNSFSILVPTVPSYPGWWIPSASIDGAQLAPPSALSFRSLQRIAFPSYLWVVDLQIPQFPLLRLCFPSAFLSPFLQLILEDKPEIKDSPSCVSSFFTLSVLCSTLGRSFSSIPLVILLGCVCSKCFLMSEEPSVLVLLKLKLG